MARLATVAVPVPQLDLLTYRVPEGIETPAAGARVLVPMGTRTITGCVIGAGEVADDDPRAAADGLREIIDVLDGEAYLPADVLALAAWVAEYYACGPGEAVAAAVPTMAWLESRRVGSVTGEGLRAVAQGTAPPMSALARRVLETAAAARSLPESALRTRLGKTAGGAPRSRPPLAHVLRTLEEQGLVAVSQVVEGEAAALQDRARRGTDRLLFGDVEKIRQ